MGPTAKPIQVPEIAKGKQQDRASFRGAENQRVRISSKDFVPESIEAGLRGLRQQIPRLVLELKFLDSIRSETREVRWWKQF